MRDLTISPSVHSSSINQDPQIPQLVPFSVLCPPRIAAAVSVCVLCPYIFWMHRRRRRLWRICCNGAFGCRALLQPVLLTSAAGAGAAAAE